MASFEQQLRRIEEDTLRRQSQVVRKIILDAFTSVIYMSPVAEGRFRGNWQSAVGEAPTGTVELVDPSGAIVIAQITGVVEQMDPGDVVYLVNNLEYARPLEEGHSQQAPEGMVALTVQRLRPAADAAIRAAAR